jgi:hypothetical protein
MALQARHPLMDQAETHRIVRPLPFPCSCFVGPLDPLGLPGLQGLLDPSTSLLPCLRLETGCSLSSITSSRALKPQYGMERPMDISSSNGWLLAEPWRPWGRGYPPS